jgi:hypothetical protein
MNLLTTRELESAVSHSFARDNARSMRSAQIVSFGIVVALGPRLRVDQERASAAAISTATAGKQMLPAIVSASPSVEKNRTSRRLALALFSMPSLCRSSVPAYFDTKGISVGILISFRLYEGEPLREFHGLFMLSRRCQTLTPSKACRLDKSRVLRVGSAGSGKR